MKKIDKVFEEISTEIEAKNPENKELKIFIRKSLMYLNDFLNSELEENELEKYQGKLGRALTTQEKRELLKSMYKKVLKSHGRENDFHVFSKMIDTSPDHYLDYELSIDHEAGSNAIEDFRHGQNPLSQEQMETMVDLFKNIGKPALEQYATGRHEMDPRTAAFGAAGLNKGFREYNRQREEIDRMPTAMKGGLPAMNVPMVPPEVAKRIRREMDSMFNIDVTPEVANILGGLKREVPRRNIENDVMRIMLSSGNKQNAKEEMRKQGLLSHLEVENFDNLWNFAEQEKEKVRVRKREV